MVGGVADTGDEGEDEGEGWKTRPQGRQHPVVTQAGGVATGGREHEWAVVRPDEDRVGVVRRAHFFEHKLRCEGFRDDRAVEVE